MYQVYLSEIAFYKNQLMNHDLSVIMRNYYLSLLIDRMSLLDKLESEVSHDFN